MTKIPSPSLLAQLLLWMLLLALGCTDSTPPDRTAGRDGMAKLVIQELKSDRDRAVAQADQREAEAAALWISVLGVTAVAFVCLLLLAQTLTQARALRTLLRAVLWKGAAPDG